MVQLSHPYMTTGKTIALTRQTFVDKGQRQVCPWSTEWSRAKAKRVLPRECTDHGKHPLPARQEETLHMDIARWPTLKSDWLYSLQPKMEKLCTVNKTRPGADCGSDHKLLITNFRLKHKQKEKSKNWLELARTQMAEHLTSNRHKASLHIHCNIVAC